MPINVIGACTVKTPAEIKNWKFGPITTDTLYDGSHFGELVIQKEKKVPAQEGVKYVLKTLQEGHEDEKKLRLKIKKKEGFYQFKESTPKSDDSSEFLFGDKVCVEE